MDTKPKKRTRLSEEGVGTSSVPEAIFYGSYLTSKSRQESQVLSDNYYSKTKKHWIIYFHDKLNNMVENAYVYILTNQSNTTLYIGVTSNLIKRIYEHKNKVAEGFTKKYNLNKLVYYEQSGSIISAIEREKVLKGKKREYKIALINSFNPTWSDLYNEII